jgi:hypothetical protein
VIFSRVGDEIKVGSTVSHRQVAQQLTVFLRPETLFLSLVGQLDIPAVNSVYRWFLDKLVFRLSDMPILDESGVIGFLRDDADLRKGVVELLQAADVGVSGLAIKVVSKDDVGGDRRRVRLTHGDSEAEFDLADESAGTRAWLGILPTVLSVLHDGGTLVVDEIDGSLHPLIVTRLVGLFHDREVNCSSAQLLFSTHDATLLRPPLGDHVLDRDEIWFIEKERSSGASNLYPLTDFSARSEDNLERRYLSGQYGAVPVLNEDQFAAALRSADGKA